MKFYPVVKRLFDCVFSLVTILIIWPLLLLIAVLIKLDSKGPVHFKQRRIGKQKKEFYILKYRTMKIDTPKDIPTHLLKSPDEHITRIGKFLRKSSLDELPQIFNILKGEMSLVGPRPALWNQYDLVAERDRYGANDVKPGLTGWAQVNGRDELSIAVKARFDGEYVKNMSLGFDIKVICMTIVHIFTAKGVVEGMKNIENGKDFSA